MEPINYHTLSDFRGTHDTALKELFVEVLGVLSAEGLISLERVMHDGTKIRAEVSRRGAGGRTIWAEDANQRSPRDLSTTGGRG